MATQGNENSLSAGVWAIAPDPVGPFTGPAPKGTVNTAVIAPTQQFDQSVNSSTGDEWLLAADPNAPSPSPVMLNPGQSGKIQVTFTPQGKKGQVVTGNLYVDAFSNELFTGDELVAVPYSCRIG